MPQDFADDVVRGISERQDEASVTQRLVAIFALLAAAVLECAAAPVARCFIGYITPTRTSSFTALDVSEGEFSWHLVHGLPVNMDWPWKVKPVQRFAQKPSFASCFQEGRNGSV